MISPYRGADFFSFFKILFFRLWNGEVFVPPFYVDELQIAVFSGIALSGALIGTFLVLKKMASFANAVSHTVLLGLAIAFLFCNDSFHLTAGSLIIAALFTALLTGICIRILVDFFKVQSDAGIAFVFCSLFALGLVVLVFLTGNVHIGIDLIMGNPDVLTIEDVYHVWSIFLFNVLFFSLFFRGLSVVSFDPGFAVLNGFPSNLLNYLIMFQTSLNLIISFKATGILMALSFLIFPQIIAKSFAKSVKTMAMFSALFGILVSFIGPALSRHFLTVMNMGLSTAGLTVILLLIGYIAVLFWQFYRQNKRFCGTYPAS